MKGRMLLDSEYFLLSSRIMQAPRWLLALALLTPVGAQPLDKGKLDQFLDRLAAKNKGMGSLTLARNGNVVYSRSFGFRKISGDEQIPLAADTKYRIASITKTFTAVMILQLVEERKLRLTDTLDKYFPQLPNAPRITLAHILLHRSGLPEMQPDGDWGRQHRTREEIVARIAAGKPNFEPDAKAQYNNGGYNLLGQIVERVGGKPYAEALQERIAKRVGLNNTYLGVGNNDASKNEALAYMYFGNRWMEGREPDFSVVGGAGGIVSTPADLATFVHALFEAKLISAESLKLMTTIRDGEGMGMVTFDFAGKTLYGNTGGSASTGAWLAYFPEEKLALAYTTNAKVHPVKEIVSGIFDIYWNRPFPIPTFDAYVVNTEVLDRYVGVYLVPGAENRAKITREGTMLYFQPGSEGKGVALEATAENKFKLGPVLFEFDIASGEMRIDRGGQKRVFKKQ